MKLCLSFPKIAVCLFALSFLSVMAGTTSPAAARAADLTKTVHCGNVPAGAQTTMLTVNLERFSIPADWSDPGSHYEIATHYSIFVYESTLSRGEDYMCSSEGNWGTREYEKYDAWTGDRWTYLLDLELIMHNVPVDALVVLKIVMREEDDTGTDPLDLNMYSTLTYLTLSLYPSGRTGYLQNHHGTEGYDSAHQIDFGRSKRFIGDGHGTYGGEAIASIDLTIDENRWYTPNVGNEGQSVTEEPAPEIGGAITSAEAFCQTYANTAIDQYHTALSRNCGFSGPEWSDSYSWHYDWCLHMYNSGQQATVDGGTAFRTQELARCGG